MKVVVRSGLVDLDLGIDPQDDRLVGFWAGPRLDDAEQGSSFASRVAGAFREPREFPPLALAVVPGDRVVVALDLPGPLARVVLAEVARVCEEAGVEAVTAVSLDAAPPDLPAGVTWERHDPDDQSRIAYLATTNDGRRVYLNRALTDADFVLPIGTLGFDRSLGYRGPWSALFPGLSDRETLTRYRSMAAPDDAPTGSDQQPATAIREASEVGWLIGCQLQVGILPGATLDAPGEVIAGLESLVRAEGTAAVDRQWTFAVAERADVVVVGVGAAREPATLGALGSALAAATRLVRRGGKIVALAPVDEPFGPSLRRLSGVENPKAALNRLRGHEANPDYSVAHQVATALAWADVYLHSGLDADAVEDLAIIPLARPEEARKLAASAASLAVVNQAERTRCVVRDES